MKLAPLNGQKGNSRLSRSTDWGLIGQKNLVFTDCARLIFGRQAVSLSLRNSGA
jgi:hypothetical protein